MLGLMSLVKYFMLMWLNKELLNELLLMKHNPAKGVSRSRSTNIYRHSEVDRFKDLVTLDNNVDYIL